MDRVLDYVWDHLHEVVGATGRNRNAEFIKLFQNICVKIKPKLFLEIGAHGAEFSKTLTSLLPGAKVIAYEANPFVFEKFKSKIPNSMEYLNLAVGADMLPKTLFIPIVLPTQDGTRNLAVANTTSSLKPRTNDSVVNEKVVCECTTVDEIVKKAGLPKPVIMWIDVEGAVGDVLFGAHRTLSKNMAAVFVEVETSAAWSGQWMASEISDYMKMQGFLPLARDRETAWQYNQIFLHKDYLNAGIFELLGEYISTLLKKNPN